MKRLLGSCLLFGLFFTMFASAQVPSLIGYQGRLVSGTNLFNGTATVVFRLYGSLLGSDSHYAETQNVQVVDGLYSSRFGGVPDFGTLAEALTNQPLFLEVTVNGVVLGPRERVAAVAYAVVAEGVEEGAITTAMLSDEAITSNKIANNTISSSKIVNNTLTSDDLATGSVDTDELVDGAVTSWKLQDAFWRQQGNSNTVSTTDFVGTTDDQPLSIRVNNQRVVKFQPNGNATPNIVGGCYANTISNDQNGGTIAGGGAPSYPNRISDDYGFVGGGIGNVAGDGDADMNNAIYSTVGGGRLNSAEGTFSVVAGGAANTASGASSAIGGGTNNTATGDQSTVSGGRANVANGTYSTVAGGYGNGASGYQSFIGGGLSNVAGSVASVVVGGANNTADLMALYSIVGGGQANRANGEYSAVVGGGNNRAGGDGSFIGSGSNNLIEASSRESVIAGGRGNRIQIGGQGSSVIGGGLNNSITNSAGESDEMSAIIGGELNEIADSSHAFIGGGSYNRCARSDHSVICGGYENDIYSNDTYAAIGGGYNNEIYIGATYGAIAGGQQNTIGNNSTSAFIGGGAWNDADGEYSTVGGGTGNRAAWRWSTVCGGSNNEATNQGSVVVGGENNKSYAQGSFIGGGIDNMVVDSLGVIGGGWSNRTYGRYAVVPGGRDNEARGDYSFAAGRHAKATNDGAFVWADHTDADIDSTANDSVLFRCNGGVTFTSGSGGANQSVAWAPGSGSWTFSSDRNLKEEFEPVDQQAVLDKIAQMPITEWNYKGYDQRHIGPMAQDFQKAFALQGSSTTQLNSLDLDGVSLAAIQGLYEMVKDLKVENEKLKEALEVIRYQLSVK